MNTEHKLCIIIPCYNHGRELQQYLPTITAFGVPVYVINDGSNEEESALITDICAQEKVQLINLPVNSGKWKAVYTGMKIAQAAHFTHILQCDADGQHASDCINQFIELSKKNPQHIILGHPLYGQDIPPARLYGRRITNFFVRLETAGACKHDSMCGFRVYPLHHTIQIIDKYGIAAGMPGDIEILVRCCWEGIPLKAEPVPVCYPEGGRSNFRMIKDNLLISWTHTKLCTGALLHPWRLVKARKPHSGQD